MRRTLLLPPTLVLLASCGGDAEPAPHEPTRAPSGGALGAPVGPAPAAATQDAGARPTPPARLFSSRFVPYGPWYPALVEHLNPANQADPWPTEVIAGLAKRELRAGIRAALDGSGSPLGPVLGRRFRAATALRPDEVTVEHARGLRVERGQLPDLAAGDPRSMDPAALLVDMLAPYVGSRDVAIELWVTGSWPEDPGFHTRCHLRLSGSVGAAALQTNVELTARWRVIDQRVLLVRLEGHSFEELSAAGPCFVDRTTHALGAAARPGSWIWEGALERSDSTDNLVVFTDVYMGMHGLGVGDLDGDGLEDLYVARQGGAPNVLLRHLPDGRVVDVAAAAGVDFLDDTCGVLIVDLDGDGARDLVLTVRGDLLIAWNDGPGTFGRTTRLQRPEGQRDKAYSVTAADADGDGDLDLYDTRYFLGDYNAGGGVPTPYHDARNGARNSLWRNEGERRFADATVELGLDDANDRFSLTAIWEDLDADGDLDLYVVNDFGRNNLYLRGDDGRYRDAAGERGLADMAAGMGVTCADANADGVLDLYVTNMFTAAGLRVTQSSQFAGQRSMDEAASYRRHTRGNTLLLGRGDGRFQDATEGARTGPGGWAWGAMFADWDNDGLPDLYVPNGFLTGRDRRDLESFFWRCVVAASPPAPPAGAAYENAWRAITRLSQQSEFSWNGHERNYVYWNLGAGSFADATHAARGGVLDDSRVGATCDWDGDGRVDLWLKNRTAPLLRHLRNELEDTGRWVAVDLTGVAPNPEAIGALVTVEAGGRLHRRRVYAGEGYLGSPSRRLHFGLGDAAAIERVTVTWPDGGETRHAPLEPGARYRLGRDGGTERVPPPTALAPGDPGVALPVSAGTPLGRTVALERFPCSALPLPRFDGVPATLRDHAGRCVLVYGWGSWEPAACEGLAALAGAAGVLEREGVDVHPLSFDGPRDQAFVLSVVGASGLARPGGRAGSRERVLVEIALQALLPGYDDVPVPFGLLFDPAGRLCVTYVGRVDPAQVAADARALHMGGEEWRTTLCLTGGRWIDAPPQRSFDLVIDFLRDERGERELAEELQAFHARRERED